VASRGEVHRAITALVAARPGSSLDCDAPLGSVILVDIEGFRFISGSLRLGEVEAVVRRVGAALADRAGADVTVGHLGRDRFAVVVDTGERGRAVALADELLRAVADVRVTLPGMGTCELRASAGIAPVAAGGDHPNPLVSAEEALHAARRRGGGAVGVAGQFTAPTTKVTVERAAVIARALADGRLGLVAQPVIDLHTQSVDCHELLLRVPDRDGVLRPPLPFVLACEAMGTIAAVDRWVIGRAVELSNVRSDLRLSVNLSARTLASGDAVDAIIRLVASRSRHPANLVLELTQSTPIIDVPAVRCRLVQLRNLGCRLALDDFGNGYTTLLGLRHLPFDLMKLDGGHVERCASDEKDRAVVASAVVLAHGLGMRVVAEHVHDDRTLATVRELGVDLVQGFHLGRGEPVTRLVGTS
jgi:diguanylate cyclase (GGDEF)-like protein